MELSQKYQQKTDKQHIIDNPDTYIGSVEYVDSELWVYDNEASKIQLKPIKYIPGLYKLFDECLVNTRDHMIRMDQAATSEYKVTYINININQDTGMITIVNDGEGIDILKHPDTNIWIPEMIFGHLRTSTNYNKAEDKIVGGKNGFGVKLVYVWSTYGTIETVDHKTGLKYEQVFENNLDKINPPTITKVRKGTKPYTKISFIPDYARLQIAGLTLDMIDLFHKRVYDLSAITSKTVKVRWNDELLKTKSFQDYVDLYLGTKEETKRIHEDDEGTGRWEYVVALSQSHEFTQISFVNGIYTQKGGKHVEYIMNQILRKLITYIETKKKIQVNATSIKEQIILFLRCDIVNPSFDSQTKDCMNTPASKFGSTCNVTDKFIEKLAKMGVMDQACTITEIKEQKALKKNDGIKVKTLRDLTKLLDAGYAGTSKSAECMLIICEGDSAKAGITSGLTMEDRKRIGVYPLKGKILNVRGETSKKINDNKEIHEIKRILGLEIGKKYENLDDVNRYLRYSKVIFMTDQDLDGSHIKGLCINLFQSEWGSLTRIPGFIGFMNTPILKARKGSNELRFYNQGEYDSWKKDNNSSMHLWNIKYYKGLGTSTDTEFREYFKERKIVNFIHEGEVSDDVIDLVFNKKRSEDRKQWLEKYDRDCYVNTSSTHVSYTEFVNKELIHFSKYDCDRSIPNIMDGLKMSLRKILYSAFKKNLTKDIKVAQFSGYVSEHSGYHHGEASLNAAIVGMSQNFVGSNNINLLVPNGQFGSRLMGGKDSASERYIYTRLNKLTRRIFPEIDDNILTYLNDDGIMVEPVFYVPIIPLVLVNGCKGIGTGFSTSIPCYDPILLIQYLKSKIMGCVNITENDFIPYYDGFAGTIVRSEDKYIISGKYEVIDTDKICITELPIGTWTEDYKIFLEELTQASVDKTGHRTPSMIKDYEDLYTKTKVNFPIIFHTGKLAELTHDQIMKMFKLTTTMSIKNMHLFDANDCLKKYETITDIIDEYFIKRLELYILRKEYLVDVYQKQLLTLSNKARYILAILNDEIDLRRKKYSQVVEMLTTLTYDLVNDSYDYLIKMPMDSVTDENVNKILTERDNKQKELDIIINKSEFEMWNEELDILLSEYIEYKNERTTDNNPSEEKITKVIRKTKKMG